MDIGIDIGGSHIGVGVVSTETGEIFIKKEKEITKKEIEYIYKRFFQNKNKS